MYDISKKLNLLRNKYARILEEKINNELIDLEMKNAKIKINIDFSEKYNSNGLATALLRYKEE